MLHLLPSAQWSISEFAQVCCGVAGSGEWNSSVPYRGGAEHAHLPANAECSWMEKQTWQDNCKCLENEKEISALLKKSKPRIFHPHDHSSHCLKTISTFIYVCIFLSFYSLAQHLIVLTYPTLPPSDCRPLGLNYSTAVHRLCLVSHTGLLK